MTSRRQCCQKLIGNNHYKTPDLKVFLSITIRMVLVLQQCRVVKPVGLPGGWYSGAHCWKETMGQDSLAALSRYIKLTRVVRGGPNAGISIVKLLTNKRTNKQNKLHENVSRNSRKLQSPIIKCTNIAR